MRAPNFGKSNYPMGGERIGPAWQAAWDILCDGEWHNSRPVKDAMTAAGPILDLTANEVLRQSARSGLTERRVRRGVGYIRLRPDIFATLSRGDD